ncbi:hypothetical protein P8452_51174 [Trifolium repens]|nr:hypothetical protein P8452_51174 [Trifolium repens]
MVLENINPDVLTFNILVDAFCKEGKVKEANNVFAMMMRKGVKPDVVTYNSLMDGYCLVKEVNKAESIFNTMAQSGVTPDVWSYSIMINGFCRETSTGIYRYRSTVRVKLGCKIETRFPALIGVPE